MSFALLIALAAATAAQASQLIDRNAQGISLAVNAKGEALVTYTADGRVRHVLAWGAVNAIAPSPTRQQVGFQLDYSGGWGKYRRDYWKTFGSDCGSYDGPPLAWKVLACTAPDGSYWALQAWQRGLPNYGVTPTGTQGAWELRLSHWTGALPVLDIETDWSWHRWDHLFGTLMYGGTAVYGFRSTSSGAPLDTFGRNVYVDTFDSRYGPGWHRENSFLTHTGTARFTPRGQRRQVPRHRRGARGHPGRDVGRLVAGPLQPGRRFARQRCDCPARRPEVQAELGRIPLLGVVADRPPPMLRTSRLGGEGV
jgi:hypothetical protein